jgi:2-hydroxychromene-2-carboxylate isomerase
MSAPVSEIDFYTSPTCPWAWRTALWIRQVATQTPLAINWKLFSLHIVNRGRDYAPDAHMFGYRTEMLLTAARRRGGNDAFERLYMAAGDALHGRRQERSDDLLLGALRAAGLSESLLGESREDPSIEQELVAEHERARSELGAFGVPTIRIPGADIGSFGPVIDPVPTGAAALELWHYVQWGLRQPYLYEWKRERRHRAEPLGLGQVSQSIDPARLSA